MPRDIRFNSGFVGCDDKCAIMRHELVPRRLKDNERFEDVVAEDITDGMYVYVDNNGEDCKANLSDIIWPEQVRSDWDEIDPKKPAYIENKPVIGDTYVKETFNSTAKVGGINVGDLILEGTPWADILKRILTAINGDAIMYWWTTKTRPEDLTISDFETSGSKYRGQKTISRSELLNEGFEWPKYVDAHSYTLDDEWHVIAFNKDAQIEVDWMEQEGFLISRQEGLEEIDPGDGYYYYCLANPSTGTFTCKYHFIDRATDIVGGVYFGTSWKRPREINDLDHLYYRQISRSELLSDGFDWESDILSEDSEGFPYAYWFTELGSSEDSEWGMRASGFNIIAINTNLHVRCTGVTQTTTATDETEGFMADEEPIGQWVFYFFQQRTRGHFKWHYTFKGVN